MKASKQSMKAIDRLQRRSDFLRARNEGVKWVSKGLILQAVANGQERSRFGLTVTTRLSKSAVIRNRIRRRLRAAAYEVLADRASPGMDYVLIGRPETRERPYESLCRDLGWCLEKLGLLVADDVR